MRNATTATAKPGMPETSPVAQLAKPAIWLDRSRLSSQLASARTKSSPVATRLFGRISPSRSSQWPTLSTVAIRLSKIGCQLSNREMTWLTSAQQSP